MALRATLEQPRPSGDDLGMRFKEATEVVQKHTLSLKRQASPSELLSWKRRLQTWQTIESITAVVSEIRTICGDFAIDQPGSPFRDAHVAMECARISGATEVRLASDPPDFELKLAGEVRAFETVEVMAPGRKRGAELWADRDLPEAERLKVRHVPESTWVRAEAGLAHIAAEAFKKAQKSYSADTTLAIYLNLSFVAGRRRLKEGMGSALSAATAGFKEIWVLDQGEIEIFTR